MAYRGLLILPGVYRVYMKMRLRQLRRWVKSWAPRGLYSGAAGVGAQDAWYSTALAAEEARLEGKAFSATSVD
eukprot:8677403-Alexandrium_andersonii.AAC.1